MHPCEPVVVHPTHVLVHPRVHRAHRLKSAALDFKTHASELLARSSKKVLPTTFKIDR